MKFTLHILGLAVACVAMPALAKPAYVGSTLNLRAAPGTGSEIVAKIPGGSLVDTGGCDEGWCEVTWQEKKGFAIQSALDLSGRVPQQRAAAPAGPAYRQGRGRRWTDLLWAATGRRLLRRTLLSALLGLAPALVVTPRL
jgi:hypothetical protein